MKSKSAYMENQRSIPLHLPLARVFGDRPALLLQQIRYWMEINEQAEMRLPEDERKHYRDGRWWVFNTYEDWQRANFDFWSKPTIERYIRQLEKAGVLISSAFNKRSGDKTKWYSIDFDRMDALIEERLASHQIDRTPSHQIDVMASHQSDEMVTSKRSDDDIKMMRALPENTTESTQKSTAEKKPLAPDGAGQGTPPGKSPAVKERPRDPIYDAVAIIWFDAQPDTPKFAAIGGRIGKHVSWLKGNTITQKRDGETITVPGCPYPVTAEQLQDARDDWAAEHPDLSRPLDILKFIEYLDGWLSDHRPMTDDDVVEIPTQDFTAIYQEQMRRAEAGEYGDEIARHAHGIPIVNTTR